MPKTTILVESTTRQRLRQIGRKNQTYDGLINELIEMRRTRDSLDSGFGGLQSSESSTSSFIQAPDGGASEIGGNVW